jgi:hypothetical protein
MRGDDDALIDDTSAPVDADAPIREGAKAASGDAEGTTGVKDPSPPCVTRKCLFAAPMTASPGASGGASAAGCGSGGSSSPEAFLASAAFFLSSPITAADTVYTISAR